MKPVITFIAGLAIGAGCLLPYALKAPSAQTLAASQAESAASAAALTQLKTEVKSLNDKLAAAKTDADDLRGKLAVATTAAAAPASPAAAPAPAPEEDQSKKFQDAIAKAASGQMKSMFANKIAALKDRLKLTPEQAAKVEESFKKQEALAAEAMKGMFGGKDGAKPDFAAMMKMQKGELPADLNIESLLDDTQKAEMKKMTEEEKANRIEMVANAELVQLQASSNLTSEQKDQVFSVLSNLATQDENIDPASFTGDNVMETYMEKRYQSRLDALKPILNETQFKAYESSIQTQKDMMKTFMPGAKK